MGSLGKNMCLIEEFGYSVSNRQQYCTTCTIFNQIGKCEYLNQCESNTKNANFANVTSVDKNKSILKIIN